MITPQDALRQATRDLLYPSESEEPFDVLTWKTLPPALAKAQQLPIERFFKDLEPSDDAPRFAALRKTLETHLRDLKVLRTGEVQVDVYIVGRAKDNTLVALHTRSIET